MVVVVVVVGEARGPSFCTLHFIYRFNLFLLPMHQENYSLGISCPVATMSIILSFLAVDRCALDAQFIQRC